MVAKYNRSGLALMGAPLYAGPGLAVLGDPDADKAWQDQCM
ncbi:MAG: hypothetical protein ACI8R4_000438 [Paracoccaceae bacterium]|jgi:hypothetical protein